MNEIKRNEDDCVLSEKEMMHIGGAFQAAIEMFDISCRDEIKEELYKIHSKITKLNDLAKQKKEGGE